MRIHNYVANHGVEESVVKMLLIMVLPSTMAFEWNCADDIVLDFFCASRVIIYFAPLMINCCDFARSMPEKRKIAFKRRLFTVGTNK
jgi:cytosine/uracil/thiamine/allantoin permease